MEKIEPEKAPIEVSRDDLHAQVWELPMSQLAARYGLSGNGLRKICDRLDIPCPARGYWAKKAAGQRVSAERLPEPRAGTPQRVTIRPTTPSAIALGITPDIQQQIEALRSELVIMSVSLEKPHPLIAVWIKEMDRERRARGASNAYYNPGELTEVHQRQLGVLSSLFRSLGANQVGISREQRGQFKLELSGETIVIQLRERQRQTLRRRPILERHRAFPGDATPRENMEGTGYLVLTSKRHLPANLRSEWLESTESPLEQQLPSVAATLLIAFPLLAAQTLERREAEQARQIAQLRRHEEQQRRLLEDNRWRRFTEIARQWEDLEKARRYLTAMKASSHLHESGPVGGRLVQEWIAWAEEQLATRDARTMEAGATFSSIASVTTWSYRD